MAERSLNKVTLIGRLGKDPELRYTSSGKAMATFSLATSFRWKNPDGHDQESTEWHRIVAWGRLGEICGEYLNKGKQVYLEGRIQSRDWEDQDGNKRTTVEIVATDMIMLGGGGQSQGHDRSSEPPRGRQDHGQSKGRTEQPKKSDDRPYYPPPPEDEIPF